MPRLDYRTEPALVFTTYELRMLLALMVAELNQLRAWLGQPELDTQAIQDRLRAYLRTHPRSETGTGGPPS